jgi:hypothetical protein
MLFIAGRLKVASDTLMVAAIQLVMTNIAMV